MEKNTAMNVEGQHYLDAAPAERNSPVDKLHAVIPNLYPGAEIDMACRMSTCKAKNGWGCILVSDTI
jgi:hypothetical protein